MKKRLFIILLLLIIPVSACSPKGDGSIEEPITIENIGVPRKKLIVKDAARVDTGSKAFQNLLETIRNGADASIKGGYEYMKITSDDTGVVFEISDEKYNQAVIEFAKLDDSEYYSVWKAHRDSLVNLSKVIYDMGVENLHKECDSNIYLLNYYDQDLVLMYIRNGEVIYDVLETVGKSYADAPSTYSKSSSSSGSTSTSGKSSQSSGYSQSLSSERRNAMSRADSYLRSSAFSHDGLVDQLEYEGFSHSDAVYAADNCGANWNEQALKKAKSYLNSSAFSKSGLTEQLEYEGFTSSQAKYGVDNCGANWNEQAVKKAKQYLKSSSFSRQRLKEQLEYEGFTSSQAEYGVSQAY